MDMIRHHDVCMQLISVELGIAVAQSSYHYFGDFRTPQKQWTAAAPVQEAIHRHECLARSGQAFWREHPLDGKATCNLKVTNRGWPTRSHCGSRLSYCFIQDVVFVRARNSQDRSTKPPERQLQPRL